MGSAFPFEDRGTGNLMPTLWKLQKNKYILLKLKTASSMNGMDIGDTNFGNILSPLSAINESVTNIQ